MHDVLKKKEEEKAMAATKEPKKTKKELEEDKRQEGLQKSLDSSNKGFAMLQKMGYKAGKLHKVIDLDSVNLLLFVINSRSEISLFLVCVLIALMTLFVQNASYL